MAEQLYHIGQDQPVPVRLRRSSRARRMSLRVSHQRGEVTLTLPHQVAAAEGLRFAQAKLDWIRRHLAHAETPTPVQPGSVLPLRGQPYRLVGGGGGRVPHVVGTEIHLPARDGITRLEAWLRAQAREAALRHATHYAAKLGKSFNRLVISDTKSRWGSCSSHGRLMLSFRLIMAPPEVLDYVVAHEVAHLQEMNHSDRFWTLCERLYGDYSAPRDWLKTHGSGLHRYRFE